MHFLGVAAIFSIAVTARPAVVPRQLSYAEKAVLHHNYHRANHSAPPVEWDDDLAATAKKGADMCSFEHKMDFDGGGYGQNIAAGVEPERITEIITGLWYNNEQCLYPSYGRNPTEDEMTNSFHEWGHFTQIVWKDTTTIGCWTTDCTSQGGVKNVGGDVLPYFTVCNYKGPGNYDDEFADQIGEPLDHDTVQWDYGL